MRLFFPENNIYRNNWDYGIALNTRLNRIALQFEMTGRYASTENIIGINEQNQNVYVKDKESDLQYIGTISYRLTNQIELTYKIGRNFKNEFSSNNDIINLLALNFGFGGIKTDEVKFD